MNPRLPLQPPARYLVLIDQGGSMLARLFDAGRRQLAEFDGTSEEVGVMTTGLTPERVAADSAWDEALRGHGAAERAAARVFTLDV